MIYRSRSLLLACQTAALALLTACAGDPPAAAHASAQPALTLAAFTLNERVLQCNIMQKAKKSCIVWR